jgi:TRAP-type uncharacterized transport system substrate-binding protein
LKGENQMHKRTRAFLATALCLSVVFVFSACGQTSAPASSAPASSVPASSASSIAPVSIDFGAGAMGGQYYIIAGGMEDAGGRKGTRHQEFQRSHRQLNQFMAECNEGKVDIL